MTAGAGNKRRAKKLDAPRPRFQSPKSLVAVGADGDFKRFYRRYGLEPTAKRLAIFREHGLPAASRRELAALATRSKEKEKEKEKEAQQQLRLGGRSAAPGGV